jgi:hypothetical protein
VTLHFKEGGRLICGPSQFPGSARLSSWLWRLRKDKAFGSAFCLDGDVLSRSCQSSDPGYSSLTWIYFLNYFRLIVH